MPVEKPRLLLWHAAQLEGSAISEVAALPLLWKTVICQNGTVTTSLERELNKPGKLRNINVSGGDRLHQHFVKSFLQRLEGFKQPSVRHVPST